MAKNWVLVLILLAVFAVIAGYGYLSGSGIIGRSIFHFQDKGILDCTRAMERVPLVNSSGDEVGYYEVRINLEDKCIAVQTIGNDSITFTLKNKS